MDKESEKKELTLQEIKILAYYVYAHAALNTSSGQYYIYPEDLAARTGISQKSILENVERILEILDVYFADELLEPAVWDGESFDVNLGLNYCMYIDYEDPSNEEFSPGTSALEEASMLQISMGFSDEQMLQIRPLIFENMDYGELLSVYNSPIEMFDARKRIEDAYCRQHDNYLKAGMQERSGKEIDKGYEIYCAARNGDLEQIKRFVGEGGNVNYVYKSDIYGYTPLHIAAYYALDAVVEYLLQNGADVNALSKDGKTPFDLAEERHGRDSTKEILLRYKASEGTVPIPDYAQIGDVFLTSKNIYLLIAENGKPVEYERSQLDLMCNERKKLEKLGSETSIDFSAGIHNNTKVYYNFDFESYARAVMDELSHNEKKQEQTEQLAGSVHRKRHGR